MADDDQPTLPAQRAVEIRGVGPPPTQRRPFPPGSAAAALGWRQRLEAAVERVIENRVWILLAASSFAVVGLLAGYQRAGYTATARLVVGTPSEASLALRRQNGSAKNPAFAVSPAEELHSPEFVSTVAASAVPVADADDLFARSRAIYDPASSVVTLSVTSPYPWLSVRLGNHYAETALHHLQETWRRQLAEHRAALDRQMTAVSAALGQIKGELAGLQRTNAIFDAGREFAEGLDRRASIESKITSLRAQLEGNKARANQAAEDLRAHNPAATALRESLYQALTRYTEEHPRVKALRAALAQLEGNSTNAGPLPPGVDFGAASNTLAGTLQLQRAEARHQSLGLEKELSELITARDALLARLRELSEKDPEFTRLQSQYQDLKECRDDLLKQQNQIILADSQGPADTRIAQPARLAALASANRLLDAAAWGARAGAGGGALGVLIFLMAGPPALIRSRKDLERATGLPILAVLGDLDQMSRKARETWAFETLSILKGNLRETRNQALICGFISSGPKEGKSTWIKLLSAAATKQGYCVVLASHNERARAAGAPRSKKEAPADAPNDGGGSDSEVPAVVPGQAPVSVQASSAQFPSRIGLADWIWNWQHRDQFEQALQKWSMIENLAVFVELPPYSTPAGVMMAETVPNLVWLSGQDLAHASRTRSQLCTLRQSQAGLAGAVLNCPKVTRKLRQAARVACVLLLGLGLLGSGAGLRAQTTNVVDPVAAGKSSVSLSITSPQQMADWQRRLTLGPGDVLDISLYGQPESARSGLVVGPDGRLNFMQARDIMATGLTVDELRAEMEKTLAKFHLAPQVVINPVAYRSKKYYLLGNVMQKGVYALDRPTTIIEAIAKGRGFINAAQDANVAMLVDLGHSFLVRKGPGDESSTYPVDFEALFVRGDLSQNIALAPDDYLYFQPLAPQEIYVLGQVRRPGLVPFSKDMTAMAAITAAGSFTDRAWKTRVLIVRGSLVKPETFVLNASDVLRALAVDIKLANRDIVYVHESPWARAEEVVERAAGAFVNSVAMGYVNNNIVKRQN